MMDSHEKEQLVIDAHPSREPEIGRRLWMLQDTRLRTLEKLSGLSPAMLDRLPDGDESNIGAILYHVAVIEADWLYFEVLEQPFPPEVEALFPYPIRDEQGLLTQIQGLSLEQHLGRLETVRGLLLDVYQQMDLSDFRQARSLEHYDVTPEWVLHHLMQHEAEHRGQIGALMAGAKKSSG